VLLFWLTYQHPDRRAAGVVVILLHARLKAPLAGADRDLEFVSGHKLDHDSTRQMRPNMMEGLLDDGDRPTLHQMLIKKKPPDAIA
jgi:hypothetical protein